MANPFLKKGMRFERDIQDFLDRSQIPYIANLRLHSYLLSRQTEIDLICLFNRTIYVIEIKSYERYLGGLLNDQYWTGVSSSSSIQLFNPVLQNLNHIRSLKIWLKKKGLDTLKYNFINIIVVPNTCNIYGNRTIIKKVHEFSTIMLNQRKEGYACKTLEKLFLLA